jgi:hypothetical protein
VLQLFVKVVRETLRATDIIGRLGGEEFVALLPSTAAEAAIAAERVRAAFAVATIVRSGRRTAATVSIGVASASPATAIDLPITRADDALYRAKKNGRNRWRSPARRLERLRRATTKPRASRAGAGEKKRAPRSTAPLKVALLSNTGRIFTHLRVLTRDAKLALFAKPRAKPSSTFRTRPDAACARSE